MEDVLSCQLKVTVRNTLFTIAKKNINVYPSIEITQFDSSLELGHPASFETSILANNEDTDEMQQNAAFHQGLKCLDRSTSSFRNSKLCHLAMYMYNELPQVIV